ncbi:hypothetical protein HELRODRAFT_144257, partial [Helobdella robusta]|uniref:Uncharacterized protein n=1 Tax=Helobdella robusta TaxID=6412 RepID=T1EJD9_HELRO
DIIEVYRILHAMYGAEISPDLELRQFSKARCNNYRLVGHSLSCGIRKFSFTERVVNVWNSLPNGVVNFPSLNTFKKTLDGF